jgi:hypothetical protein
MSHRWGGRLLMAAYFRWPRFIGGAADDEEVPAEGWDWKRAHVSYVDSPPDERLTTYKVEKWAFGSTLVEALVAEGTAGAGAIGLLWARMLERSGAERVGR